MAGQTLCQMDVWFQKRQAGRGNSQAVSRSRTKGKAIPLSSSEMAMVSGDCTYCFVETASWFTKISATLPVGG